MKTWYLVDEDGNSFECPYCHIEITDCTGELLESCTQYCQHCGEEF